MLRPYPSGKEQVKPGTSNGPGHLQRGEQLGLWALGAQGPPAPRCCIQGSTTVPAHPHCHAGLCIQSQGGQGKLKDLTGRAYRLYLELKETKGRQTSTEPARPQTLLFPLLPRRQLEDLFSTSRTCPQGPTSIPTIRVLVTHVPWSLPHL